jgi:hypothetical protein
MVGGFARPPQAARAPERAPARGIRHQRSTISGSRFGFWVLGEFVFWGV